MSCNSIAQENRFTELCALAAIRRELRYTIRCCNDELENMSRLNASVAEIYRLRSAHLKRVENQRRIAAGIEVLDFSEGLDSFLGEFGTGFHYPVTEIGGKLARTNEKFDSGRDDLIELVREMQAEVEVLNEFISNATQTLSPEGPAGAMCMHLLAADERARELEEQKALRDASDAAWAASYSAWTASGAAGAIKPASGSGHQVQVLPDGERRLEETFKDCYALFGKKPPA